MLSILIYKKIWIWIHFKGCTMSGSSHYSPHYYPPRPLEAFVWHDWSQQSLSVQFMSTKLCSLELLILDSLQKLTCNTKQCYRDFSQESTFSMLSLENLGHKIGPTCELLANDFWETALRFCRTNQNQLWDSPGTGPVSSIWHHSIRVPAVKFCFWPQRLGSRSSTTIQQG